MSHSLESLKAMWLGHKDGSISKRRLVISKIKAELGSNWTRLLWMRHQVFQKENPSYCDFALWCGDYESLVAGRWENRFSPYPKLIQGLQKRYEDKGWSYAVWTVLHPEEECTLKERLLEQFDIAVWSQDLTEIRRLIKEQGTLLFELFDALSDADKIKLGRRCYQHLANCEDTALKDYAFQYDKKDKETHVLAKILNANLAYRVHQLWFNQKGGYTVSKSHKNIMKSLSQNGERWALRLWKKIQFRHNFFNTQDPLYFVKVLEFSMWCFDLSSIKVLVEAHQDLLLEAIRLLSDDAFSGFLRRLARSILSSDSLPLLMYAIALDNDQKPSNLLSALMRTKFDYKTVDGNTQTMTFAKQIFDKSMPMQKEEIHKQLLSDNSMINLISLV